MGKREAPWPRADALVGRLRASGLQGVGFRATSFALMFSKYAGQVCQGVQIHILDRDQLDAAALGVHLLTALRDLHAEEFTWRPAHEGRERLPIDLLAGSTRRRRQLDQGIEPERIVEFWAQKNPGFP